MSLDRLRYEVQLMGKRIILTPVLVMAGFALLAELPHYLHTNPARTLSAGLELILPIAAGVVVATVISQDPVIELQLTLPRQYHLTGMLRVLLIAAWTTCIALLSSGIIVALNLGFMPQPPHTLPAALEFLMGQLVWLAPLLWLAGFGFCLALLLRSRSASAALLGGIWVLEIIFKDVLAYYAWLRPVLLFPTTLLPLVGRLPQAYFDIWLDTRLEVLGTGLALCLIGWLLLRNPEGLLKGASEE
jgi:hypothetical protein